MVRRTVRRYVWSARQMQSHGYLFYCRWSCIRVKVARPGRGRILRITLQRNRRCLKTNKVRRRKKTLLGSQRGPSFSDIRRSVVGSQAALKVYSCYWSVAGRKMKPDHALIAMENSRWPYEDIGGKGDSKLE